MDKNQYKLYEDLVNSINKYDGILTDAQILQMVDMVRNQVIKDGVNGV